MLDSRGRLIMERRGVRRSSLAYDAYHFTRTATWSRMLGLFAAVFVLANLVFATVLYVGHMSVTNANGFLDDFWFSVQTMGTIGYGVLAPDDSLSNAVVMCESFFSIILTALVTGVIFARFATPSARVLFSNTMIIGDHDGQRSLQFRMANERTTALVEATAHLYMTREETLANGERFRRVYDLPLRRTTSPVFALSFLVIHPIDKASPLYGITAVGLRESNINVIVTLTAIDDQLAQTVHARYMWNWNEIEFDRRYVDMIKIDENGTRYLDLEPINETEPIAESAPTTT